MERAKLEFGREYKIEVYDPHRGTKWKSAVYIGSPTDEFFLTLFENGEISEEEYNLCKGKPTAEFVALDRKRKKLFLYLIQRTDTIIIDNNRVFDKSMRGALEDQFSLELESDRDEVELHLKRLEELKNDSK